MEKEQIGEGVEFERTRRITGYLVGTTKRFNNAKQCEEKDRVKHGFSDADLRDDITPCELEEPREPAPSFRMPCM